MFDCFCVEGIPLIPLCTTQQAICENCNERYRLPPVLVAALRDEFEQATQMNFVVVAAPPPGLAALSPAAAGGKTCADSASGAGKEAADQQQPTMLAVSARAHGPATL